jgi:hypothetical protein
MRNFDIAAYDADGQIVLVVEIKKQLNTSRKWATMIRRNLYEHGFVPSVPYFLLATPDRFYLWEQLGQDEELAEPDYEIDPRRFLSKYIKGSSFTWKDLSHESFEIVVASWLHELLLFEDKVAMRSPGRKWLEGTGLLERIRDGQIAFDAVA